MQRIFIMGSELHETHIGRLRQLRYTLDAGEKSGTEQMCCIANKGIYLLTEDDEIAKTRYRQRRMCPPREILHCKYQDIRGSIYIFILRSIAVVLIVIEKSQILYKCFLYSAVHIITAALSVLC